MTLDKDNIYSGIEGKLRTLNFSRILKSFEDKVDFSTPNTRSKSKKLVHSTIEKSLAGLIGNIGIDNNWLASVISPDVVESLGKLPTSSLKYLESDLIIAITNYCINTLDSDAHYSILPYQTSINRFLILYLFLSNNMADVRKRLSTPYYTDEFTNIVANNEMSKANKNIQSVAISDSDIKLKYKEFLKELGVVNDKNLKALNSLLLKLLDSTYDDNRKRFLKTIYSFENKGIAFLTKGDMYFGQQTYSIGVITGNYINTETEFKKETPYTSWILYSRLYMFSFVTRKDGSIGFIKDNIYISTYDLARNLSDAEFIAKYGNIQKSYEAYENEVSSLIAKYISYYNLGKPVDTRSYSKILNQMLSAKVL